MAFLHLVVSVPFLSPEKIFPQRRAVSGFLKFSDVFGDLLFPKVCRRKKQANRHISYFTILFPVLTVAEFVVFSFAFSSASILSRQAFKNVTAKNERKTNSSSNHAIKSSRVILWIVLVSAAGVSSSDSM
ncbi:hypothetical protein [Morganella psychrotolerans]|uniref:hypothetical protein n=1 Tax=Morganella psychrotolerans TaxID=368603 RepID=UPI001390651E|nr:hypothetical protein [Morganella psychrotolerans]